MDELVSQQGAEKAAGVRDFVVDYREAVVPLLTTVVAEVSTALDETDEEACLASLDICTSAGTEEACCVLDAGAVSAVVSTDAEATLGARRSPHRARAPAVPCCPLRSRV